MNFDIPSYIPCAMCGHLSDDGSYSKIAMPCGKKIVFHTCPDCDLEESVLAERIKSKTIDHFSYWRARSA